jgi:hypothetical protein
MHLSLAKSQNGNNFILFLHQTQRATFTALRFPVLEVTGPVLAFEVVESGRPGEAHQPKHSTTCWMATPTMLENKMPLLRPSSAFLTVSIVPLVKRLSLADLHHVSPITGERWATTLPPPSVPRASIPAPLAGQAVSEFPVCALAK